MASVEKNRAGRAAAAALPAPGLGGRPDRRRLRRAGRITGRRRAADGCVKEKR